jgi:hypothetical protein
MPYFSAKITVKKLNLTADTAKAGQPAAGDAKRTDKKMKKIKAFRSSAPSSLCSKTGTV